MEKPWPSSRAGWLEQNRGYGRKSNATLWLPKCCTHGKRLTPSDAPASGNPPESVLVSATDPQAVLARDKLNVFRALYSPQLLRDLDSP